MISLWGSILNHGHRLHEMFNFFLLKGGNLHGVRLGYSSQALGQEMQGGKV